MRNIVKFIKYFREHGLTASIFKLQDYFSNLIKWNRILKIKDLEGRFTKIYESNAWNDPDSVSGTGSSKKATELLRSKLPSIFEELKIRSVFDAPCGDFHWFKLVLDSCQIRYLGADIVTEIIDNNNFQYSDNTTNFVKLDITKDEFPKADLMFCRDFLFHLSFSDIRKVLINFINSDIDYLMTSTHVNQATFENFDIVSGDYRKIDLFSEPFNFPNETVSQVDDWLDPEPKRKMCIWTKEQIKSSFVC